MRRQESDALSSKRTLNPRDESFPPLYANRLCTSVNEAPPRRGGAFGAHAPLNPRASSLRALYIIPVCTSSRSCAAEKRMRFRPLPLNPVAASGRHLYIKRLFTSGKRCATGPPLTQRAESLRPLYVSRLFTSAQRCDAAKRRRLSTHRLVSPYQLKRDRRARRTTETNAKRRRIKPTPNATPALGQTKPLHTHHYERRTDAYIGPQTLQYETTATLNSQRRRESPDRSQPPIHRPLTGDTPPDGRNITSLFPPVRRIISFFRTYLDILFDAF